MRGLGLFTLDELEEMDEFSRREIEQEEVQEALRALKRAPTRRRKAKKKKRTFRVQAAPLTPAEWWQLEGLRERKLRNKFVIVAIKEGLRRIRDAA